MTATMINVRMAGKITTPLVYGKALGVDPLTQFRLFYAGEPAAIREHELTPQMLSQHAFANRPVPGSPAPARGRPPCLDRIIRGPVAFSSCTP